MFLLDPLHLDNSGRDPAQRGGSLTLAPLKRDATHAQKGWIRNEDRWVKAYQIWP
jgi:hypothetical protein